MGQNVCVLGATGSIGQSTLKVLSQHENLYCVYAVTAQTRMQELALICQKFRPKIAVVPSCNLQEFQHYLTLYQVQDVDILTDEAGLVAVSSDSQVDIVMAAIVGAAGLVPTFAAVKAGKKVLLANKEALVMSGDLMMQTAQQCHATLLPVDSEHNAIFQSLPTDYHTAKKVSYQTPQKGVEKLILTASGGPFLHFSLDQLAVVTPEQACKHPNWSMGQKISVDSATLMNKGLELIEACHLFGLAEQYIDVVIHPQSIIHSLVQYIDGSTLAQLGNPDMCTPIAHALAYPERIATSVPPLDLVKCAKLEFFEPDLQRFPALTLARQAMKQGGTMPAVLNAANEVAVAAFLNLEIGFMGIYQVVEQCLQHFAVQPADNLEQILAVDAQVRQYASRWIQQHATTLYQGEVK